MILKLDLPWPPSSNTYWRRNGSRYFISTKGQSYRKSVYFSCHCYKGFFSPEDRLTLIILAFPPDKRKRDLDNICKATLDSIQYAEVFEDDCQIDELIIKRMPEKSNKLIVTIERNN